MGSLWLPPNQKPALGQQVDYLEWCGEVPRLGYWLNECDGGIFNDLARGFTGTLSGTTAWGGGPRGAQLTFSGAGTGTLGATPGLAKFTVYARVMSTDTNQNETYIVRRGHTDGFGFNINDYYGRFIWMVDAYGFGTPTADGQVNIWRDLIGTYDGTNRTLWMDGVAYTGNIGSAQPATDAILRIGNNAAANKAWKGQMDRLLIWDSVLSEKQMDAVRLGPVPILTFPVRLFVGAAAPAATGIPMDLFSQGFRTGQYGVSEVA